MKDRDKDIEVTLVIVPSTPMFSQTDHMWTQHVCLTLNFQGVEVPLECSRQYEVLVRFPSESLYGMESIIKLP